jgi:hypothetical protein
MMSDPLSTALAPVLAVLEEMGVLYYVGGSVASMAHGEYRQTADADVVADLRPEHAPILATKLEADYYVDEAMIRDAIARRSSFNVVHKITSRKPRPLWAREELRCRTKFDFGRKSLM